MAPGNSETDMVCVGRISGAHGVRGGVKVQSFTQDPRALASYGPLFTEGRQKSFHAAVTGMNKDQLLLTLEGVTDRDVAGALAGTLLFVPRSAFPALTIEDDFYHADLIGLTAQDATGNVLGSVVAVHDFGGGDVLEIREVNGETKMLPFTRAVVPVVKVAEGFLQVAEPVEIIIDEAHAEAEAAGETPT